MVITSSPNEDGLTESMLAGELDVSPETIRAYLREDRKLRINLWVTKDELSRKYYISSKSKNEIYN